MTTKTTKTKKTKKKKVVSKKKSYIVEVKCNNCHSAHYTLKIPYGTTADTPYLREQKCRDCGCIGHLLRY